MCQKLGLIVEKKGGVVKEVGKELPRHPELLECLKSQSLRIPTFPTRQKDMSKKAVVWGILLYGSETWITKRFDVRKLEAFQNRCMRTIMGIS